MENRVRNVAFMLNESRFDRFSGVTRYFVSHKISKDEALYLIVSTSLPGQPEGYHRDVSHFHDRFRKDGTTT